VIAVNPTDKKMILALDLAGEGPGPEANVLFENRTVKLANMALSDPFEPLAVHVYEIGKGAP
jgi:hypothetical protein